jgi:hypothetical protein
MDEYRYGQVLFVAPGVPFSTVSQELSAIGFERDELSPTQPPLIPGEPEVAAWKWPPGKPYVTYTFNPVARLRVLDVATVPPVLRGAIASRLELVAPEDFAALLESQDARTRLLGLWIAREGERLELLPQVQRLQGDRESVVAQVAKEVSAQLQRVYEARLQVFAQLRMLAEAAKGFLPRLQEPSFVQSLRPTREDCAKLFDPELVDAIVEGLDQQWAQPPEARPGEQYHQLEVTAAPAGLLRYSNELSDAFPRGYRDIAGGMAPNRMWLAWVWKSAEGGTVRYDGLAWLGDHWIWFPKPYRILRPLILKPIGSVVPQVH